MYHALGLVYSFYIRNLMCPYLLYQLNYFKLQLLPYSLFYYPPVLTLLSKTQSVLHKNKDVMLSKLFMSECGILLKKDIFVSNISI